MYVYMYEYSAQTHTHAYIHTCAQLLDLFHTSQIDTLCNGTHMHTSLHTYMRATT